VTRVFGAAWYAFFGNARFAGECSSGVRARNSGGVRQSAELAQVPAIDLIKIDVEEGENIGQCRRAECDGGSLAGRRL
jgi:hypothetical protein